MESFVFAFNTVAPIIIMVVLGWFLKKAGIIGKDFVKAGNKLVFKVFLPVMLFSNVYKIENIKNVDLGYIWYSLMMIFAVFCIAVFTSGFVVKEGPKRAALVQGILRTNYALIGIPVAGSLFGEEATAAATVLSAFAIPLFNILAVAELSYFGKGKKTNALSVVFDIAKNPLILGVAAGFAALGVREIFIAAEIGFRLYDIAFIEKTAGYISAMTTPFSLIILGADFEISAIKALKKEIVFGTVMKCAAVPLIGVGTAFLLLSKELNAAEFAAIAALFSAPVAVSSLPLAQEMGADTALAGQMVIWTTVCSSVSIFAVSFFLKMAGIF